MTAVSPELVRRIADMHAVYRMFDHAGRLLYIGMTGRAGRRFDDHAIKRWFPMVAAITLEWHETHAEAVLAERRAIAAEHPRYNVVGTPLERKRVARAASVSKAQGPKPPGILADVLKVFGDAKGLPWQIIAERLCAQFPDRWADVTKDAVSAHCRALGVPSLQVKFAYRCLMGCRRTAVEEAATRLLLQR